MSETEFARAQRLTRELGYANKVIGELQSEVDELTGHLQNCVNHLDRAKRRSYTGNYDECIESANRALSKAALKQEDE